MGDDADGRRAIALLEDLVDTSLIQVDPDRATGEVTITYASVDGVTVEQAPRTDERIGAAGIPGDRIAAQAWSEPVSANLVQVYISYLRRKIGAERIRTVRGEGYVLEA